jgi:Nucleoside 2-deoxyribosyltransferase like
MSRCIYAPQRVDGTGPSLFLAGGITGCPDWQAEAVRLLSDLPVTLLNPRRPSFPMNDPSAAAEQIEWEHQALRRATAILFWFPGEALCPIALYELGAWSMTSKQLFVGTHPGYPRRQDVVIQTALARSDVAVVDSLSGVICQARAWLEHHS